MNPLSGLTRDKQLEYYDCKAICRQRVSFHWLADSAKTGGYSLANLVSHFCGVRGSEL